MRERELKKEWTEVSQVIDSALADCLTASRDRGRKHRESERRVSDKESERQRAEFGVFVWNELKEGLIFSSNSVFCTFFFSLNFGLNRPFRRFRPIWLIQADVARVRDASAQVSLKKINATWHDAARRAGSGIPPRPAASDAGTAHLVPRPCFTVVRLHCENWVFKQQALNGELQTRISSNMPLW